MKLGTVTKLDKRNTATSKKFDNDVMLPNCDIIVIFLIYGQFGAIGKPNSRCMVCKLTFSLIVTFYLTKLKAELKNL